MKSENTKRQPFSSSGTYILTGVVLVFVVLAFIPACTHDPFSLVEPDPMDTIDNPIDTTDIDTTGIPCDSNEVYFNLQILPLLQSNCAKSGCHDVASHEDDIILDSYENLINSDIVDPFDLDGSDLYEVITESDPDKRMPQPPNQRLTSDQVALIAKWISQGAKNITCDPESSGCDTVDVSYSGFIAPLLATYCVGCHSGPNPANNMSLVTYADVRSVALDGGKLLGAVSWANGYFKMPKGATAPLPSCTIDKIKSWIQNGAPNN